MSTEQKALGEERKEEEAEVRMELRYLLGVAVFYRTCEDQKAHVAAVGGAEG